MIVKYREAKQFRCPIMHTGERNCIGPQCMLWKWETNKDLYYDRMPDYTPAFPRINDEFMISFEKGASGRSSRVEIGEAMGECGLISRGAEK